MSSAQMQLQQGQAYQQGLVGVQQPQFNRRDSTPVRATPSVGQLRGQQPGQYRASMGARIGSEGAVSSGAEEELVRRAVGGHRTTSSSSGLSRVHSGGSASGSGDEGLRGRSRASDVGARREERRGGGDGGSLGIYSHAHSPLKKASSMYDITRREGPRNGAQAAAREVAEERERVRRRG
ncbi:hypothetical protein V490_05429 [Pseudogymnoascus sp. VKM F-3557]|nr:hypothetical protein V490_05429 [Pseudogymnoascus sp. VKM F-3557]